MQLLSTRREAARDPNPAAAPGSAPVDPKGQDGLSTRILTHLNAVDGYLDRTVHTHTFQTHVDKFAAALKKQFAPLQAFNQWLQETDRGDFYDQLASSLVKLPARAAWNVVTGLYAVISTALYVSVHPMDGAKELAVKLRELLIELKKPEVWPQIGAGSIGFLIGESLLLSSPLSWMGIAIGGAMLLGGITLQSLQEAMENTPSPLLPRIQEKMFHQMKQLPETVLTGFFWGLLIGGIRRGMQRSEMQPCEVQPSPTPISFEKILSRVYLTNEIPDSNRPD